MASQTPELKETELLLVQNLMKGENSGLDYGKFREPGVNKARYRGSRSESLYESRVLEPAREAGRITQVRFYSTYDDGTGPRPVQVRLYTDTHVSTTKPVEVDFLDTIEGYIADALSERDYLIPLEDLLNEFVYQKFSSSFVSPESQYKERIINAFDRLIEEFFDEDDYQDEERYIFQSIIANIGIKISRLDLTKPKYMDVEENGFLPREEGSIKEFFDDYSKYVDGKTGSDFDVLWNHLHHIITVKNWENPLEIIRFACRQYDL